MFRNEKRRVAFQTSKTSDSAETRGSLKAVVVTHANSASDSRRSTHSKAETRRDVHAVLSSAGMGMDKLCFVATLERKSGQVEEVKFHCRRGNCV